MLQSFFDKLRPHFEEGGKLHAFHSVFEGMETFVLVPNTTAKVGVSIHDAIDSKRIMTFVIIALLPALFFGMYNIGYQTYMTPPVVVGASFWEMFAYGFLIMLPKIVVSYAVGLGIEFAVAQYKHEEINEGYLVTGLLIPMIVPIELPLWMLAVAVAFSVIFAKEIFGGTGMNFFNPALVARAFLFFSYSGNMTGDKIWIAKDTFFGLGNPNLIMDTHCFLADDVERIRRRWFSRFLVQQLTYSRQRDCKHPLVRTFGFGRFLLRCSLYGNRPGDECQNRERKIHLWLFHWCFGYHHPRIEPRLPGRYDAGYLVYECMGSLH